MLEFTMNDTVYQFNFGIGFLREINKTMASPVDGVPGAKKNVGYQYALGGLIDGDVEALIKILDIANKTQTPRVTMTVLEKFVENETTDIDMVFEQVIDFLSNANSTKKVTKQLIEAVERERAKKEAQNQ